jgi:transmembrane 9 superfamily protein 2/4
LLPGLLFAITFVLNLFVWAQASSTALPFSTLVALIALWVLIQLPLVHIGSWFGFSYMGSYTHPIKASTIPRQVPSHAWWTSSVQAVLLAGLVPFAVIFIELLFVFKSTWQDKSGYYYVFGFLAFVVVLSVATVAEVTIVSVYVMLCYEVSLLSSD